MFPFLHPIFFNTNTENMYGREDGVEERRVFVNVVPGLENDGTIKKAFVISLVNTVLAKTLIQIMDTYLLDPIIIKCR